MRLVSDDMWAVLTIWAEARGESQQGRVGVGEVIRNRMRMRHASDGTVPGTVLYPVQFSCWNALDRNRILAAKLDDDDPVVQGCRDAWREAASSAVTGGAVCYVNPQGVKQLPSWVLTMRETAIIGAHHFYALVAR